VQEQVQEQVLGQGVLRPMQEQEQEVLGQVQVQEQDQKLWEV
jgi:hypothetical protein